MEAYYRCSLQNASTNKAQKLTKRSTSEEYGIQLASGILEYLQGLESTTSTFKRLKTLLWLCEKKHEKICECNQRLTNDSYAGAPRRQSGCSELRWSQNCCFPRVCRQGAGVTLQKVCSTTSMCAALRKIRRSTRSCTTRTVPTRRPALLRSVRHKIHSNTPYRL